jgi:dolichyl-phosphate-mannose-protein mannosyltransferase
MPRKKPAVAAVKTAAAPAPERRSFVIPARFALPVAIAFIALAIARIVSTYSYFASTSDEPAHVACGLEYLASHTYGLETQHPPLARAFVALLPYLSGTRPRGNKFFQIEGYNIITYEHHPDLTMTRMRLGVLPFFVLACLVTFFWTRRYFGPTAAAIATALFTLIPPVLAHAGLATTDMALTACLSLAFFMLLRWAEQPDWSRAVIAGFCCGLAVLSKFTALGFLPASVGLALIAYYAVERPSVAALIGLAKRRAPGALAILAIACLTIWAAYRFSWKQGPAPEFFDGIQAALKHANYGHEAWLLGQHSLTGWWYYFPVALAVKTPLALLLVWGFGIWLCWKNRRRAAWLMPAAFALGVLLPAMQGKVNIGVRHVMPVYIAMCIMAALAVEELLRRRPIVPVVLVGWMAVSGALHHPDYIPYFNELVPRNPDYVLVDSDYDWGQDTKRLAARLRELGAAAVNYGWVDSPDNQFLEQYPGLPHITNIHPLRPAAGWTAVRPTLERSFQYGLQYRYPDLQPWYDYLKPRERVGTILLYYVSPEELPAAK